MKKRIIARTMTMLLLSLALSVPAYTADIWTPSGPITICLAVKAGGSTDMEIKAFQSALEKELGVPLQFEYLSAPASKMYVYVAQQKPDGQTIGVFSAPSASIKEVTDTLGGISVLDSYDFIINISSEYRCLAARPSAPYNSIAELIEYAKAGNSPSIATSGIGNASHMQLLMMEEAMGIDLNDVPFNGSGSAKAAFLGGHVELWAIDCASAIAQAKAGECKILAICAPERNEKIPDVPTFSELGYNVISSSNHGIVTPKGTPENVQKHIAEAFLAAAKSESVKNYIENNGLSLNMVSFQDYYNMVKTEGEKCLKYKEAFVN